MMALRQPCC